MKTTILDNHVPRPNRGGSAVRASGVHYLFHGTVTNIRISKKRMVKLEMFEIWGLGSNGGHTHRH